jgi:hypothetical protein
MAAITYGTSARGEIAVRRPAAKKKGFWSRLFDAMVEAQMRKAQREIELHRHLLPAEFRVRMSRPNGDA